MTNFSERLAEILREEKQRKKKQQHLQRQRQQAEHAKQQRSKQQLAKQQLAKQQQIEQQRAEQAKQTKQQGKNAPKKGWLKVDGVWKQVGPKSKEPQLKNRSVRTISGGAFEMNRRKH